MVYNINGKEYYTMEESKTMSSEIIKKNAKKFAQKVIRRQKNNRLESN